MDRKNYRATIPELSAEAKRREAHRAAHPPCGHCEVDGCERASPCSTPFVPEGRPDDRPMKRYICHGHRDEKDGGGVLVMGGERLVGWERDG